jgi:hypothetical protein
MRSLNTKCLAPASKSWKMLQLKRIAASLFFVSASALIIFKAKALDVAVIGDIQTRM